MCSIEELGSTTDMYPDAAKDGIYILSDNPEYKDAKIGSDVVELLGLHDVRFEYEITSNRVDCFRDDWYCKRGCCNIRQGACRTGS